MTSGLNRSRDFWDKRAAGYAASKIKDADAYEATLKKTVSYLKPDDCVLELGAGTGSTAVRLAPHVARVLVTDISPNMIAIARKRFDEAGLSNGDFAVADCLAEDIHGPFDVVLAHNVLHLVEDLSGVLRRVHELTRPGGLFISKTFCRPEGFGSPLYYVMRVALPLMQAVGQAPYVAMMRGAELDAAIAAAGFEIVEEGNFPARDERRYVVARRRS